MTFYYINADSILLFPFYGNYFMIGNDKGIVDPTKIKFVDDDNLDKVESHYNSSANPIIKLGNKIYINNAFGWIAKEEDDDKFLLIEYDLKTGVSNFLLKHPPSLHDLNLENTTYRHLIFTYNKINNSILYSFGVDPNVYEFIDSDNYGNGLECAPEDYKLPKGLKEGMSSYDMWIHFQTNFSFSNLVVDDETGNIIRVYLYPYSLDDIQSGQVDPENPKKPSLLLFSKEGEFLAKIKLDEKEFYYFINIFSHKGSLWIQKIVDNEDYIHFEKIDLGGQE